MQEPTHFKVSEKVVLVADDDETFCLLARQALAQSGLVIATAADGVEALSSFERLQPDLVLLDVHMPGMDGFEVCNRIRRQPSGFHTPILILTGSDDVESIERAYMMGATDFATKPVNWTVLSHRVRYILRAAQAIQRRVESEARNRALVEALPDMILQITRDGKILDWRPASSFDPLVPPEDFLGRKLKEILPPEVSRQCMEGIEQAFETNRIQRFEYSLKNGNSEGRYEARIIVFGRDRVLAIVRDITEQKLLLEELHQSQKMESLGLLASGVAHDFNNALTVISFSAGVLRGRVKDDGKLAKRVEAILDSTRHAAGLTSQLLAFSRKQESRPQVVDLNSAVLQTQKMLNRLLGEDIEVSLKLEKNLSKVLIDPTHVGQILMNLAANARDAMPGGGKFHMETRNLASSESKQIRGSGPAESVRVLVSDTGCGMEGSVLERIFEPFFTTKGVGKGTGLGLSTVFGIVKQAGGDISVVSNPGQGTTFEINLPRFTAIEEELPAGLEKEDFSGNECSETILLVEDDPKIRDAFSEALRSAGYQILEAPNGVAALELARGFQGSIDLLLTDVVMPEMNGPALAEELLALRPELKVLFVSGYPNDVVQRQGIDPRTVNIIQKPFDNPVLGVSVRDVLDSNGRAGEKAGLV